MKAKAFFYPEARQTPPASGYSTVGELLNPPWKLKPNESFSLVLKMESSCLGKYFDCEVRTLVEDGPKLEKGDIWGLYEGDSLVGEVWID